MARNRAPSQLGGSAVEEHVYDEGLVRVMADPAGVEFCLVGRIT